MNPTRPGYLTTEFWVTVATQIIALVTLFHPDLGAKMDTKWVQPVAVAAAAVATFVYTHVRGKVKTAASHPLAFAPVPQGVTDRMPFAADQHDDDVPLGTPISDEHHDKVFGAKKAPARKRA